MNDREKLIDMVMDCDREFDVLDCYNGRPRRITSASILADHLIANGVVVSEEITELKADNERLLEMWAKAVSELSKAKAEQRPKGEWDEHLDIGYDGSCNGSIYQCRWCHELYEDVDGFNFCPKCGADMRAEEQNRAREGENDG